MAVVAGAAAMRILLGTWWPVSLFGLLLTFNLCGQRRRSPTRCGVPTPAHAAGVTVPHRRRDLEPWRRYGKDRLYVNAADGTTLGHVDLHTNAVVPTEERFRVIVERACSDHLRDD